MLCRTVLACMFAIALVCGATTTRAATITSGSPIALTSTSFVLPVAMTGAVALTAWQFGLGYDPADVQIDTACVPFVDAYCNFLTGPVNEGEFFLSGVPFNVLSVMYTPISQWR